MAEPIIIKIALDASDISQATGKIRTGIKSALDSALPEAREAGKRLGNALAAGMAEGLAKARQLRTQLDQILNPAQRQRSAEASERVHQQRLTEIRERGAQQQAAIQARAAAQAERDARRFADAQERIARRAAPPDSAIAFFKRYSSTIREAGESVQQFGYALTGLTTVFVGIARASVQSAIDIDKNINILKSLTGSAEAAEKRYAALIALSAKTPGLTTNLAATLDAQLRVANVTQAAIDKVLPAIGRLNAVSTLGDPQKFAQNLIQLVTQNFERTDLKELVGQSPLAGEIIKGIFGVDNATNAKAIREAATRLGITSTEAFFTAFAEAAANNPKLANVTESLGTQIEKLRDRVLVALRPLGLAIVQALTPLVETVVPIIERVSKAFSELPQGVQQAILVIGALAAALGPLVLVLGGVLQAFGAIGNIITVIAGAGGLGAIATAAAPVAAALAAIAAGAAALYVAWQNNFLGIREVAAAAFAEVSRFATENLKYILDFYRENLPIFKEAIANVLAAVRAFWAEHGESITRIVKETWEIVSTVISTVIRNVLDIIKLLAQVINGDLIGAFTTFAGIVKRSFDAAVSIIADFSQRAFEQFKLLGKLILEAGVNLATEGVKIGYNIVSGLIQGIKSRFGEVTNVFKEMGKGAILAAKAQLGIQSPSKVFYEIGINTADGYILGLEASKGRVRVATKDLVAAGIADLPDPDKILDEIRRTQREADTRRNFALDQIAPLTGFNPSAIGAETLPKTLNLKEIEDAIPPLTAAADAVRRFGAESVFAAQAVSPLENAFTGLIDSVGGLLERGLDTLTRKLGIFGGFVKSVLGSVTQSLLGGLGGALGGRGGIGGFIGNIFGKIFGGGSAGASGLGSFFTGGFSGGGGAASILGGGSGGGGLFGSLAQSFGLGPSAPASLSSPLGNLSGIASLFRGGSPGGVPVFTQDILTGGGQLGGGGLGGVLGNLFSGIGFGKAPGSGGALAGALPLLGLSLGASLGTDRLTSILGGAAGGLLGIGLSAAPGIIGAGGALSGLGFLAPLFSNPITAIAAGLALPAVFLLGRARQRKRDERSSGDFLQDAVDQIKDIRRQVESNELTLTVGEARKLFDSQILQPFIAQINTLKTKSVRESRLKNQTVDLRNLFEKEVIPAVQAQKARQGVSDKLIPEFALGGIVPGFPTPGIDSVLARVSPGEMVLTVQHQRAISAMAGGDVFSRVGVPNAGSVAPDGAQGFARGGIVAASTRADATPTINMTVQLVVSADDAVDILNAAAITDDGQQILVNARRGAQRNRLTR